MKAIRPARSAGRTPLGAALALGAGLAPRNCLGVAHARHPDMMRSALADLRKNLAFARVAARTLLPLPNGEAALDVDPFPALRPLTEARELLERARTLIPPKDRRILLSPPRLVARFLRFALARHAGHSAAVTADDIRARDVALVGLIHDFFVRLASRYFRVRIEGVEHVPPGGPALVVGNHNGGLVPIDSFFTAMAIHGHFGLQRAVYSMVHDFIFEDPVLRHYALALGMLRAGEESARHVFAQGHLVLVYPGSDFDTFRPFRDRGKVVLGGRTGFLKLALRERVPIVPVVSAGTQEQFIVVTRGDRLARWLHAHDWARTDVAPIVLALPWGLTSGFVPYWPLPAQTTVAFCEPFHWPELGPADAERPEVLQRCYHQVEQRMQSTLDRLMEGRRFLLGKPARRLACSTMA